ncbi:hypothetical protein QBC42DRAFT_329689, partial [Cladorrhinum samala]
TEHRPRRSHRKSRNGCSRCKARRIKCDESTPKCSRCTKMNLTCQYPVRSGADNNSQDGLTSPESVSCHSSPAGQGIAALFANHDSPLQFQAVQNLSATEYGLFNHYLEHTSRDATVPENDQFTLQVMMPQLACESKALMRSLLAISAICQACDLIRQPSVAPHQIRNQVLDLLSLSHRYHMESLRQVRLTLHEGEPKYDHVLANAALMGMQGSAGHSVRIWLTKTGAPVNVFMPKHPQWVSFYRAVDIAYGGLIRNPSSSSSSSSPCSSSVASPGSGCPVTPSEPITNSHNYPASRASPSFDHPLFPIISATIGTALSKLCARAQAIEGSSAAPPTPELQACFTALAIFTGVVSDVFNSPASSSDPSEVPRTPGASSCDEGGGQAEADVDPVGKLKDVSPWMRRYIASITYVVPSRLPRRIVAAFIHKVPAAYLGLVEDMFDLISGESESESKTSGEPSGGITVAHQLALEIFAHFLVLFILLDNVWWIGGIGAWELGRVVEGGYAAVGEGEGEGEEGDWWPESMWEVSRQLDKHRSHG